MQRAYDPANVGSVAALAYTLEHSGSSAWRADLEAGMQRATARDPKAAGPGAALHDPGVLIGLCLGARGLQDRSGQYMAWCASVVRDMLARPARRVDPMLAYAAQISASDASRLSLDSNAPLSHRAALDWWFRRPENRAHANIAQLMELRRSIVEDVLSETRAQLPRMKPPCSGVACESRCRRRSPPHCRRRRALCRSCGSSSLA